MRHLAIIILFLVSWSLKGQESTPLDIYLLNAEDFKNLITKSSKEYHLIYSFGYWCKPCRETMPKLMEVIRNRENLALYPLMVEKLTSEAVPKNVKYLKDEFDYNGSVFSADPALDKKPWKAYEALIEGLAPGHDEYGMSLILLFDKQGKLLMTTNYNMTSEEKIERLNKALDNG